MALPVEIGERFAERYVVSHIAGGGGMSVVVGAKHDHLGQLMAVKFLSVPSDLRGEAVQRFFQEARAAASLRSEHIVRVTDAGTDEKGRHFIAMEYLDGSDLAHLLQVRGPLPIADAVGYILHACEGIVEAHAAGIIHRDLKPANLFATRRIDGTPLVKVLDFGISKISKVSTRTGDQLLSHPDSLLGTPTYMAPEQLRTPGDVDARTDVWALGLILFELLTGKNPFAEPTAPEIFAAILSEKDAPPAQAMRPDLPPGLSDVIARCLLKDPALRTGSAGALAAELLPWSPHWAHDAGDRAARVCESAHSPSPARPSAPALTPDPLVRSDGTPPSSRLRDSVRSPRGRRLWVGLTSALVVAAALALRASRGAPIAQRDTANGVASAPSSPDSSAPASPGKEGSASASGATLSVAPTIETDGGDPLPPAPPVRSVGSRSPLRSMPGGRRVRPQVRARRVSGQPSSTTEKVHAAPSADPLDGRL